MHNVCGTLPEPSAVWPKSASASEVCTHFRLEGGFPSRMKSSGYCLPKDFDHSEEALFSFWIFFLFLEGKWSIFKYFAFSVNGLNKNYLNSLKRKFLCNRSLLFSQRKHLVETDIYAYLWLHPLKEFASPSWMGSALPLQINICLWKINCCAIRPECSLCWMGNWFLFQTQTGSWIESHVPSVLPFNSGKG